MSHRQNPLYWAFSLGTWCGIRVRVSWLMPLLLVALVFNFEWRLGAALFGVIFVSVLLHEIGHIVAGQAMDGSGDEILIWPFGGLAFVDASSTPRAQFVTAAGGPVVNALLCGLLLPKVWSAGFIPTCLNPLYVPISTNSIGGFIVASSPDEILNLPMALVLLAFWVNWVGLLINLIPAYPLDGGQMVRAWLMARMGNNMAAEISVRVGLVVGLLLAVVSILFLKSMFLVSLAFFMVVLALMESVQIQSSEAYDDSFMGYDFSQGYTSLEKSERTRREPRPGLFQRWLDRRRADKQRRLDLQQQEVEQKLDAILAKVHEQGMASLTPAEKRLLKRASNRFRSKDGEQR